MSCFGIEYLHINFLILTNISSCKTLVKISAFSFSDLMFWIKHYFPTFCLNQIYLTAMWFDVGVILGLVATTMALLLSSYIVELDTNCSFSLSITKLSIISLIRLFKGSNALTELDNVIYLEFSVDRSISICSFDTKTEGNWQKLPQIQFYS